MATRSQRGAYWQLENGKYFVPTVDQVGGWSPDAPVLDSNGNFVTDERGNLIPMSARPPQVPYSVRDTKGAWLAKGEGGTPFTYNGVLPGFGGSNPANIEGILYDSPLTESYAASNIESSGLDMPGLSIIAPYFGAAFGPSLFGNLQGGALAPGESAVAGSGVWSGGSPIGGNGGGMWDWLDSIVGNTTDTGDWWSEYGLTSDPTATSAGWSSNPSMSDLTGGVLNNSGGASWWSQLPPDVLRAGGQIAQKLGQTAAESFLRDASAKLTGGSGRGILDQIQNDPLGSAFNATPFLLALAQANKQAGDIDGVLSKINGEGYTQAVLHPYDLATGQGRTALEQSLSDRGVAGSSFGYNDLNNYDYSRNLGRGDLTAKALMTSANVEGNLINQRNLNTNMLLGAGLNASGRLFSPQRDPFGLNTLLV